MKGNGKGAADDLVYGLGTGVVGNTEVEVDRVPDVADELLRNRFVQPVESFESPNIFRSLLVADVERASGSRVHDQECECGHRQDGWDEPEDPVHSESQHAGFGLLTGVLADLGRGEPPDAQATQLHRVSADTVAIRLPITSTRPNTVVQVVSVHLMIEQRDDSTAQFYVSRTGCLKSPPDRTYG